MQDLIIHPPLWRPDHASHYFTSLGDPDDGDVRCMGCDCRPHGRWGHLPCGIGEADWEAANAEYEARWAARIANCQHDWKPWWKPGWSECASCHSRAERGE